MSEKWAEIKKLQSELSKEFKHDLHETWTAVNHAIETIEKKLVESAQKLGKTEEHFFVGEDEEIDKLIAQLRALKKQQESNEK